MAIGMASIMAVASDGAGDCNRCTASHASAPIATGSSNALMNVLLRDQVHLDDADAALPA